MLPLQFRPEDVIHEFTEFNRQVIEGVKTLSRIRSEQVLIGQTPKEEVYREDKMVLYHYTPVCQKAVSRPGADRLRAGQPPLHGRFAGKSLVGAQPA